MAADLKEILVQFEGDVFAVTVTWPSKGLSLRKAAFVQLVPPSRGHVLSQYQLLLADSRSEVDSRTMLTDDTIEYILELIPYTVAEGLAHRITQSAASYASPSLLESNTMEALTADFAAVTTADHKWETEFGKQLAETASLSPTVPGRRASLGADPTPERVYWGTAGHHFCFVNREAQAEELLSALSAMENLRKEPVHSSTSRWEALRRRAYVPVCTGIPGLGKTRFAREAVHHLAELKAAELNTDLMTAANALPFPGLCRALVHACLHDCNLRLDCSEDDFTSENDIAVALLAEWCKRHGTKIRTKALLRKYALTVRDALHAATYSQ